MAEFLLRWLHFLAGITWIGLLYYFNFVQGPFMAEADPATKSAATQKLVPRALAWFRWSAVVTFLSGAAIIGKRVGGSLNDEATNPVSGKSSAIRQIVGAEICKTEFFVAAETMIELLDARSGIVSAVIEVFG